MRPRGYGNRPFAGDRHRQRAEEEAVRDIELAQRKDDDRYSCPVAQRQMDFTRDAGISGCVESQVATDIVADADTGTCRLGLGIAARWFADIPPGWTCSNSVLSPH